MLRTITIGAAVLLMGVSVGSAQNWEEPDANKNGIVTLGEWQEFYSDKESQFSRESDVNRNAIIETEPSERMVSSYDLNRDGEIDADEFRLYQESVL